MLRYSANTYTVKGFHRLATPFLYLLGCEFNSAYWMDIQPLVQVLLLAGNLLLQRSTLIDKKFSY